MGLFNLADSRYDLLQELIDKNANDMIIFNKENKTEIDSIKCEMIGVHKKHGDYDKNFSYMFKVLGEVSDGYNKLNNMCNELKTENDDMKKTIVAIHKENDVLRNMHIKDNSKNLNPKNVAKLLHIPGLTESSLKYYLADEGYLLMKINNCRDSYNLTDKSKEIGIYRDKLNNTMFTEDTVTWLQNHKDKIVESLEIHKRRKKRWKQAKENISRQEELNYAKEIGDICGIKDKYDDSKWGKLYDEYEIRVGKFRKKAEKWRINNINPKTGYKPSVLRYLINEGKGDILLRIACELNIH